MNLRKDFVFAHNYYESFKTDLEAVITKVQNLMNKEEQTDDIPV